MADEFEFQVNGNEVKRLAGDAHPEVTPDDDVELTEELADTTTIGQLFDSIFAEVATRLGDLTEVSMGGNPVLTHVEIIAFRDDVLDMLVQLRSDLIIKVAKRVDPIDLKDESTGRGWVYADGATLPETES